MNIVDFLETILGSILIGSIFFAIVVFCFPKWKLLDFPERYGLSRPPLPYPAGIAIVFAFLISVFFWLSPELIQSSEKIIAVLLGLLVITLVSFIDDRVQLSAFFRLGVQLVVAVFLVWQGVYIEFLTNPSSAFAFHLPVFLGGTITVFWIIGCMNAVNWLDGVPNLAVSNGLVSSLIIGVLALSPIVHQPEIAVLSFCFAGVLLSFVLGNLTKTRYILGDSGSMTIGFLLAVFSVFSGGKMATMLIAMSIPIFDGVFVFFVRLIRKQSPFTGKDHLHLHDQLVQYGWKGWHILLLYLCISLSLGFSVLFLETIGKLILIFLFALVFFVIRWMMLFAKRDPK